MTKLFILLCLFLVTIKSSAQTITIQRQSENNECTTGYLSVNDSIIAYSLERADFANSKSTSRILPGNYKGFIRTDKKIGWRIELVDVPDRENIQIHLGNYPFQTTGCILVGTQVNLENCTVLNSATAMAKLKSTLLKVGTGLNLDSNSSEKYSITIVIK